MSKTKESAKKPKATTSKKVRNKTAKPIKLGGVPNQGTLSSVQ